MNVTMVSLKLSAATKEYLKRLFAASPLTVNVNTLFCPVLITPVNDVDIEPLVDAQYAAKAVAFRFPYSSVTAASSLVLELYSPDIDGVSADLITRYGGARSMFTDQSYSGNPYMVFGHGNDLSQVQRGWIANMSTTLAQSQEPIVFEGAVSFTGQI